MSSSMQYSKTELKKRVFRICSIPYYNMVSSAEFDYTWFKIAKNGTRSILKILKDNQAIDYERKNTIYIRVRHRNKFKFCVIRNPWDRLVSCYTDKIQKQLLFEECWDKDFDYFIDFVSNQDLDHCNEHFRRQTKLFPLDDIDYIAKMETFG